MTPLYSDTEDLLAAIRPDGGGTDPLVWRIEVALRQGSGWIGDDDVTSERGQLRYALYLLEQATVMSHRRLLNTAQALATGESEYSFLPEDVSKEEKTLFSTAAFEAASEDFEAIADAIAAIRNDFGFDPDSGGPAPKPGPQPPLDPEPRAAGEEARMRREQDDLASQLGALLSAGLKEARKYASTPDVGLEPEPYVPLGPGMGG